MKGTRNTYGGNDCCYGGFSEKWKYDAYVKRKNWFRRNKFKLFVLSAAIVIAVTVGLIIVLN